MKDRKMKVSKRPRPHYKKERPAAKKGHQTRKSGKGTSLMHAAARKQSASEAAESSMSPEQEQSGKPSPNRADHELSRLLKNCD